MVFALGALHQHGLMLIDMYWLNWMGGEYHAKSNGWLDFKLQMRMHYFVLLYRHSFRIIIYASDLGYNVARANRLGAKVIIPAFDVISPVALAPVPTQQVWVAIAYDRTGLEDDDEEDLFGLDDFNNLDLGGD
ncbi:hypothetical protein BDV93DRAFT_549467 [Ceratobasidium sp. AG-I]|nr:hypothetical protein BDV93DRAFT_549467 [Ceratobasidium sp. AG-I]